MENVKRHRRKVLIAEDEDTFRDGLRFILLQAGYEPLVTVNGHIGRQLIDKGGVELVISDINMPNGNGLELMTYARDVHKIPVVLMTGLKSIIQMRSTGESNSVHFLAKPFREEDLFQVIHQIFPEDKKLAAAPPPEDAEPVVYCKLPIADFVSGREIKYDIYVQLSSEKFVKIAHGGSSLPMEQIQAYREKGVDHLYMRREDFREYLKFNLRIGQALKSSNAIANDRKLRFLQQTSKLLLQSALVNQVSNEALEQCTEVVETAVSILADNDSYFNLMDIMQSDKSEMYAHSLTVSLYSALMATRLGWTSPTTMFYISAGALFHDIGKKEIPVEILRAIPETPDEVVRIVQQHHENESGSGYPFHLKKGKIYPLARLVTVADEFCDAMAREPVVDGDAVLRVLGNMVKFSKNMFDPDMIAALMTVFRFPVPDEIRQQVSVSISKNAEVA